MDDDQAAIAVADAIRQSGGIKPERPPTAEELAEIEERRQRFRHYWHHQNAEHQRQEEAGRLQAQRQYEEAENRRIAAVKAEARESARQHYEETLAKDAERRRNAAIARQHAEWEGFKSELYQLQQQKQRQAWFDNQARLVQELDEQINGKPESKTVIVNVTQINESPVKQPELSAGQRFGQRRPKSNWGSWK